MNVTPLTFERIYFRIEGENVISLLIRERNVIRAEMIVTPVTSLGTVRSFAIRFVC